jgi:hypothetical protein
MNLDREKDAEIGRDVHRRLHRLALRLATRHGISRERAADFLMTGSLFLAAEFSGLELDEAVELMQTLARSVQEDELPPATRH